jgi:hypothetical protein
VNDDATTKRSSHRLPLVHERPDLSAECSAIARILSRARRSVPTDFGVCNMATPEDLGFPDSVDVPNEDERGRFELEKLRLETESLRRKRNLEGEKLATETAK